MAYIKNTDSFIEGSSNLFHTPERAKAAVQSDLDNLNGAISSEQSARENADSALDGRLDVLEGSGAGSVAKAEQDAKAYADQKISDLVNGAPGVLDTLKEIADQLASDESVVSALTSTVASNLQTAKDYADAAVLVEKNRAESAEGSLDGRLDVIEGSGAGSIAKSLQDSKDYADAAVLVEKNRAESAESALSGRISSLEADPTTKSYVDGQISSLDGRLDSLEADPTTKTYVDGQISSEQSARQSADNALDGRLDALEADPTTKSYVDGQVSSLDGRLDALEADPTTKSYVDGQISSEASARSSEDATFFKLDGSRAMTGGMRLKHAEKSANYTLQSSDYMIGVTSVTGGKTMTLPSAASVGAGQMFVVKDQSGQASATNYIRVAAPGSEKVDGQSYYEIRVAYESVAVMSNGSNWFIV